jgi:Flp pilus assembly pilin Flp
MFPFTPARPFRASCRHEKGQTMVEYAVVLAVITAGAVAIFTSLSGGIEQAVNRAVVLLPG